MYVGFFMLKYIGYIGLLVLMISEAAAQKIIEKSWNAELFKDIQIISDEVFKITIVSEATKSIQLTTRIEGEFSENIIVEVMENPHDEDVLRLSIGFTPYFKPENDKLAAHKVHAIEMELYIPEDLRVHVRSSLASVNASGTFRMLQLELGEGNSLLTGFQGNAKLNSKNGDITVYCQNTQVMRAITTNGTLTNKLPQVGIYSLEAQSVNGDITLLPSQ